MLKDGFRTDWIFTHLYIDENLKIIIILLSFIYPAFVAFWLRNRSELEKICCERCIEERKYNGVKIGKSFSCFWTLPLSKPVGSHFTKYTTYCVSKVSRMRRRKFHFYAIIYATNTSLFLFLTRFSHEMYVNSSSFRCSVTLLLYAEQTRETAQGSVPCWVVVVSRILLHFLNHFILKRKKKKEKAIRKKTLETWNNLIKISLVTVTRIFLLSRVLCVSRVQRSLITLTRSSHVSSIINSCYGELCIYTLLAGSLAHSAQTGREAMLSVNSFLNFDFISMSIFFSLSCYSSVTSIS